MHSTYNSEDYEHEQKEDVADDDTIVVDLVPPYGYSPSSKVSTSPAENGKFHYIINYYAIHISESLNFIRER